MRIASLLFGALLGTLTAATLGQSFHISGALVSEVDGGVVTEGHVSATLAGADGRGRRRASAVVQTDADPNGRFNLAVPSAGIWRLTASGKGFPSMVLDEHEGFFTGAVVSAETPSIEITFQLVPNATIQGVIVDEAGEPVRTSCQVMLLRQVEHLPDEAGPSWQVRASTQPDDLGMYEFSNLLAGRYEVMVQAQPWYATGESRGVRGLAQTGGVVASDSQLDMAYPPTWYPGVTDSQAAGVIEVHGGESREADLRLTPLPSIHLKLPATADSQTRRTPEIRILLPDGLESSQALRWHGDGQGGFDLGGLTPGSYAVSSPGSASSTSILQVGAGPARTLDLRAAVPTIPVRVEFAGPDMTSAPTVRFTNVETGRTTVLGGQGGFSDRGDMRGQIGIGGRQGFGVRMAPSLITEGKTVELAAGRYEVRLAGTQGQYLTGMNAIGADTSGRFVSIQGGAPQLMLHVANGHATLEGRVTLHGRAASGAMVLLVPASLGDPKSLAVLRRDQTNTDGSFTIKDMIPGQYILVAIDHGWKANWRDGTVLQRYLLHGLPLEVSPASRQIETVEAQLP